MDDGRGMTKNDLLVANKTVLVQQEGEEGAGPGQPEEGGQAGQHHLQD